MDARFGKSGSVHRDEFPLRKGKLEGFRVRRQVVRPASPKLTCLLLRQLRRKLA